MVELGKDESMKAIVPNGGIVIPCHTWEINKDPIRLPTLPDLPDFLGTGLLEEERKKETKLIKIAAFNFYLIGLTNKGHVLKIDGMRTEDSIWNWYYVSQGI